MSPIQATSEAKAPKVSKYGFAISNFFADGDRGQYSSPRGRHKPKTITYILARNTDTGSVTPRA